MSNCHEINTFRNSVAKELLEHQDLNVSSFGRCWKTRNEGGVAGSRRSRAKKPLGMLCRTHRFMMAVENAACPDYITGKLIHALECGAIPIIKTVDGHPNYAGILGTFPFIDAGRPGWIDIVRKGMFDDAYYLHLRTLPWSFVSSTMPEAPNYHCAVHELARRAQTAPLPPITIPKCLTRDLPVKHNAWAKRWDENRVTYPRSHDSGG